MNFEEFKKKFLKVDVEEYPNNVIKECPNPVISVLIITYNHVKYINDAIEGVLMQKINVPYEIIIGDDDSNDGTREKCIEYAKKYPEKIRLFLHKRENNIKILNKPCLIFQFLYNCFHLRGKYVAGVSGDDYWTDPYKLQIQYEFLSNNPKYTMCYHKWLIDNDKMKKRKITGRTARATSIMYINIFEDIPIQLTEVLAEDTFIKFILSTKGKKKYIKNIKPAIYRELPTAIWSLSSKKFKHDNEVLSATKLFEAYKNTKYKTKLEALLLSRIIFRKLYILRENNRTLLSFFKAFIKEGLNQKLTFISPFKFKISDYQITYRFFITFILIALNNLKWKFKYFFNI